jgi:hypothetical protein
VTDFVSAVDLITNEGSVKAFARRRPLPVAAKVEVIIPALAGWSRPNAGPSAATITAAAAGRRRTLLKHPKSPIG